MLRMSSTVATASKTMITSPSGPATPPASVSPKLFCARGSWTPAE